ncbi:MAG: hypothetical protein U0S36_01900 [Candidatus Nanopelagicales bacterium]
MITTAPAESDEPTYAQQAEVLGIITNLEAEGLVVEVSAQIPHPGSMDIGFKISTENLLVMVADGLPDVRIVGTRREYDRPPDELDGVLRDWVNFRRGWHA